jgi:hypothetical protein
MKASKCTYNRFSRRGVEGLQARPKEVIELSRLCPKVAEDLQPRSKM